jgi:hypothetical protein
MKISMQEFMNNRLNVMHVKYSRGTHFSSHSVLWTVSSSEYAVHYKSPSHQLNRQYSDKTESRLNTLQFCQHWKEVILGTTYLFFYSSGLQKNFCCCENSIYQLHKLTLFLLKRNCTIYNTAYVFLTLSYFHPM